MKRRTEIIIKTDRLVVFNSRRKSDAPPWCESCAAPSTMLTVDEAAALNRSTARAIYQRVEAAQLHFMETPEGRLFICLNSLKAE